MRRTTAPLTMIAASSTTLTRVRRRSAADDRWGPRIDVKCRNGSGSGSHRPEAARAAVASTAPAGVDYRSCPLPRRTTSSRSSTRTPRSSASRGPDRRPCGASRRRRRAARSARSRGAPARPSSCSSTAARRTPTPGTPSRSRSTARSSRSTSPATGTPSHRDDHAYWPAENAASLEQAVRELAPDAQRRRRHVARRAHRARAHRPRARPRASARARRRDARREPREVVGDRAVHRRPEYFESFDEILERTIQFNPTRSESSLRRGILHNAIEADDGRWRWRYDLPRRGIGRGRRRTGHARARRPLGRGRTREGSVHRSCAAARRPSSTTTTSPRCCAGTRTPGSSSSKAPVTASRATSRSSLRRFSRLALRSPRVLEPLPDSFVAARDGLHALAEHVLAPARYRADGHIGLVPTPGGFGTPTFGDGERVRVDGVELVHERPGTSTRVGITTLGAAAAVRRHPARRAGRRLHAGDAVRRPTLPLALDADAAARARGVVRAGRRRCSTDLRETVRRARSDGAAVIWPEHFDLACELGRRERRARARTTAPRPATPPSPQPYLYVGPWDASRRTGKLAAYPFGAAITYAELRRRGRRQGRRHRLLPRRRGAAARPALIRVPPSRPVLYAGAHGADLHPHGRVDRRAVGGHRQGDLRAPGPGRRARARHAAVARRRSPTASRSTS